MPSRPPTLGSKPKKTHKPGSKHQRPNGARWRKRREAIRDRHPLCCYCRAKGHISVSDTVDHIIALALGGTNEDDNLVGCCRDHNLEKAKLEAQWVAAKWPVSSLDDAAPVEGSLAWFVHMPRNNIAA